MKKLKVSRKLFFHLMLDGENPALRQRLLDSYITRKANAAPPIPETSQNVIRRALGSRGTPTAT